MTLTLIVEYYHLYEQQKEYIRNRRLYHIKNEIQRLVNEKPSIITSSKVFQQVFCGKNILLIEKESIFEYNSWIDVTDLVDIDSKIDSSVALSIKFKVEFADLETEKSYKEHVEQFSNHVLESYGDGVEMTTNMIVKLGMLKHGNIISCNDNLFYYVRRLHWSLRIFFWLNEKIHLKVQTVLVKKIVTMNHEEIV